MSNLTDFRYYYNTKFYKCKLFNKKGVTAITPFNFFD